MRDKTWNEDAARKLYIAILELIEPPKVKMRRRPDSSNNRGDLSPPPLQRRAELSALNKS